MPEKMQPPSAKVTLGRSVWLVTLASLFLFLALTGIGWGMAGRSFGEIWPQVWDKYSKNREDLAPLASFFGGSITLIGAGVVAWAALRQARNSTRQAEVAAQQAETARQRHEEQTRADLQRRIIESFSKAVEQLGSNKMPVCIGGIYTLERIARESKADYWPVMETLTAFVRERTCWKEAREHPSMTPDTTSEDAMHPKPTADIAAVLDVLHRRSRKKLEQARGLWLDLSFTDLRGANIRDTHLRGADFRDAHLEKANLMNAYLEEAYLHRAHLEGANLRGVHLEGANLRGAYLDGADLRGANLRDAKGLNQAQLDAAFGNEWTTVPNGMLRPPTKKKKPL